MNDQEKKVELVKYLTGKAFVDPKDQEAEIAKMAASVPAATAAEQGATTDIAKAYVAMQIERGSLGGVATANKVAQPTADMSPADRQRITRKVGMQMVERKKFAAASAVEQFIIAQPPQSEYIKATTGVVNYESWQKTLQKIENGEIKVVPEDMSKFNEIKAKAIAGAEMAAKINSELPKTIKLFKVKTPDAPTAKYQTSDELCMLLIMKTDGKIEDPNDDTKPSVSLRIVGGKPDPKNAGATKPTKTVIAVNHKTATLGVASNYKIAKRPSTTATKDYTVRSMESFRVYTGRNNKKNEPITRVVTVPLTVSGQALEVLDEFAAMFSKESTNAKKKAVKLLDAYLWCTLNQ